MPRQFVAACSVRQVTALNAGNVEFLGEHANTTFTCPVGSNFVDSFGGLYGPNGSYPVVSPYCPGGGSVLVSTLDFKCVSCSSGQYSLFGGSFSGAVGKPTNYPCLLCPTGGVCTDGVAAATPGYWGAGDTAPSIGVSFALCPTGYCCDGSTSWPCTGMGPCTGHRAGVLCGDCAEGFVETVGSAQCTAASQCASDKVVLWSLIAAGELLSAILHLTVVSGVWLPSKQRPSGKMKLAIFFAQVVTPHSPAMCA
jgi:hypothetical protein